ncbi:MAG TPA: hypothetical protein VG870_03775 [Chitinophagaceae bacterium]|nr:hypothetical protein [Chitinophagaceae bacterium]
MKRLDTILLLLGSLSGLSSRGQEDLVRSAEDILREGTRLYRSEMASWYGTDLFLERFRDASRIGGYLSYVTGDSATCIFYSKEPGARVLGTMVFDTTYDVKTARVNLDERDFTEREKGYYIIRQPALQQIRQDTLFQVYPNTNLNLVPLIYDDKREVYALSGTSKSGVVLFGNDYLLTFDGNNRIIAKKKLHRNLMEIEISQKGEDGKPVLATLHTHLPGTGEFITPTDICTLMLYEKFTPWQQHYVISEKYTSIWDCRTNRLAILLTRNLDKITGHPEPKRKEKDPW